MRVHCCCCCVCGWDVAGNLRYGWDVADNNIGDAGAVALAKALESGQCKLESLDLKCESAYSWPSVALAAAACFFPAACFCFSGWRCACTGGVAAAR